MNLGGALDGRRPARDRPGSAFVLADREEHDVAHGIEDRPQHFGAREARQVEVLHERLPVFLGQFFEFQLEPGRRLQRLGRQGEQIGG